MAIFKGAGVAIVTPMKDNLEVDYDKLEEMINRQIDGGTDAIVIAGTTGESATLTMEEHRDVIRAAIEFTKHRVPVVAGTGSNCTRTAIQLSQEAEEAGADGLLIVTPYYNKATQAGLIAHYSQIADNTKCPIIMYNVPGRTGVNMKAETVLRLAHEFPNIVAIKEASGNFAQIDEIIKNKPTHFMVISGDDGITFPLITLGAVGVISVVGNAFPREFSRMVRLAIRGDLAGAREIHYRFAELMELLFVDGNPAGVKSLLSMLGFIDNELRLPLVPTTLQTTERIREVLEQIKAIEK